MQGRRTIQNDQSLEFQLPRTKLDAKNAKY